MTFPHDFQASGLQWARPKILAVIPCLNEAKHIGAVAAALLREAPKLDMTIVIADGGSTDGTREIAQSLAAAHPQIRFMPNEKRLQSAALNKAVACYGEDAEFLIRVDAHCGYPDR
jgi:succinoglycan biosynthesis protein ExoA